MKRFVPLTAAIVALLAVVASLGVMGAHGWPPLFWDANLQITPAMNRASGRGDTFAAYGTRILSHELNDYRFNWHGQIYQALLGGLLPGFDFLYLMQLVGWLNAFSALICAGYFYCHVRFELRQSALAAALWGLLGAASTAAVLLHWQGRADQLVPAILCLSGLVLLRIPAASHWQALTRGATVGVLAATTPLPAVILMSAYLLWEAGGAGHKNWIARSILMGFTAAIVWAAFIWLLCPYSPLAILKGAAIEAGGGRPRGLRLIPAYWLWSENYPLIGGIYVLFALSFVPTLSSWRRLGWARCAASVVLALNLFRWLWIGGLAYPPFFYSIICCFPVVFLRVVDQSYRLAAISRRPLGRIALGTAALLGVAVSLGYVRNLALLPAYLAHGESLAQARARAQNFVDQLDPHTRIGFDAGRPPAFIVLADRDWHFLAIDFAENEVERLEKKLSVRIQYLFHSQHRDATPPSRYGPFALRDNHFVGGRPSFLGIELAPAMPGYQFAVYERVAEDSHAQ